MKHIIFDYNNFMNDNFLNNIRIKTPETRNGHTIIPIKILWENKKHVPLFFKTPKIYMPFKPTIANNLGGYIRLSFDNLNIDPNLNHFYNFLNNFENYLENMLIQSNLIKTKKKMFKKMIKHSDSYPDYINLNFNSNYLKVYDNNLEEIKINNIDGNLYAYYVIELIGFYHNQKTKLNRLIWDIIQFKIDKSRKIIDECLFLDESNIITPVIEVDKPKIIQLLKNDETVCKFFKMVSMGIPIMAVKHKMTLSGIDTRFLDYPSDFDINNLPYELKNKLSNTNNEINNDKDIVNVIDNVIDKDGKNKKENISGIANNNSSIFNLLSDINKGPQKFKIKKSSPTNNSSKIKDEFIRKGFKVPSLLEIQEARNKLLEKNKSKNL
jgi:hypothetical protein